ncbi:Syntaxin-6 [Lachnellula arida]|uniref:Syntaxin-6 n=1 Tax=Lachnellula arida TaxID=1316785 RepID=A0A8T9BG52_9HELO|nr:Syntaxin-6 [Lachnellula arida]
MAAHLPRIQDPDAGESPTCRRQPSSARGENLPFTGLRRISIHEPKSKALPETSPSAASNRQLLCSIYLPIKATSANPPHRDVLTQLRATRPLFTSYLRIRSLSTTSSTTSSPELASARTDLETSLSALADDLADLVESVKAVQSDPYKYGLEIEEVSRRQRLCEEVGGEVEDMKEELSKNANRTNKARTSDKNGVMFDADMVAEGQEAADNYAEFEQQQQVHMMAEQDTQLDSVFHTVGNLRQQASDMGRELEEQAEILDTTDALADRAGDGHEEDGGGGEEERGWVE